MIGIQATFSLLWQERQLATQEVTDLRQSDQVDWAESCGCGCGLWWRWWWFGAEAWCMGATTTTNHHHHPCNHPCNHQLPAQHCYLNTGTRAWRRTGSSQPPTLRRGTAGCYAAQRPCHRRLATTWKVRQRKRVGRLGFHLSNLSLWSSVAHSVTRSATRSATTQVSVVSGFGGFRAVA